MNCSDTQKLLSAFYDGELSGDARAAVTGHLETCTSCSECLTGYQKLSEAFSQSEASSVPSGVWDGIVQGLEQERGATGASHAIAPFGDALGSVELAPDKRDSGSQSRRWTRATYQRLAIAASILILLGFSVWLSRDGSLSDSHNHQEFVATMDHYLRVLPENPDQAEQFLLKKYKGIVVDPDQAVRLVGYRPAVADGLPEGYSLASTSVLKMPCCTCVKAVCRRSDGSTLVLFEHDDEETEWFGDRASSMAMCGDKECSLVELDSSIAATWREGSRSVTAVGARDQAEIAALVTWFEQRAESS